MVEPKVPLPLTEPFSYTVTIPFTTPLLLKMDDPLTSTSPLMVFLLSRDAPELMATSLLIVPLLLTEAVTASSEPLGVPTVSTESVVPRTVF